MMTLDINKQKMYYANQDSVVPIYERDEDGNIIYYEDEEGNSYPLESGDTKLVYGEPIKFFGNLSMSGGESEAVEFGLDVSGYDAILITSKDLIPIDETSLIWFESEVVYENEEEKIPDEFSADYKVLAVKPSLNVSKYILGRRVK